MSRDRADAVHQAAAAGGRVAVLTFLSYQQSQGGAYECRVAGPRNNTERLPVCIGECHARGVMAVDLQYHGSPFDVVLPKCQKFNFK